MPLPSCKTRYYAARDGATLLSEIITDEKEFTRWARMECRDMHGQTVRVRRRDSQKTGNTRKVTFLFLPDRFLATKDMLYRQEFMRTAEIGCDWSNFLRLTRRLKGATDAEEQVNPIAVIHEDVDGFTLTALGD